MYRKHQTESHHNNSSLINTSQYTPMSRCAISAHRPQTVPLRSFNIFAWIPWIPRHIPTICVSNIWLLLCFHCYSSRYAYMIRFFFDLSHLVCLKTEMWLNTNPKCIIIIIIIILINKPISQSENSISSRSRFDTKGNGDKLFKCNTLVKFKPVRKTQTYIIDSSTHTTMTINNWIIVTLPSGRRHCVPKCKSNRLKLPFIPNSIKLLNNKTKTKLPHFQCKNV